MEGAA
jgi:WD40 repeat protein